jgi:hypothetical protein
MSTKAERTKLRKDKPGVWVPVDPGNSITGTVVEVTAAWSDVQYDGKDPDSGFYPLLRIEGEADGYDGQQILAVHCFAAVLRARVLEQQPAYGDTVIITYEGTSENAKKGQSAAELYRLAMPDRDPQEQASRVYAQLGARRTPAAPVSPDAPVDTTGLDG